MTKQEAIKIVKRHYRQVQKSPAPTDWRRYALVVLDDLIRDLEEHRAGQRERILRSGVSRPRLLLDEGL